MCGVYGVEPRFRTRIFRTGRGERRVTRLDPIEFSETESDAERVPESRNMRMSDKRTHRL